MNLGQQVIYLHEGPDNSTDTAIRISHYIKLVHEHILEAGLGGDSMNKNSMKELKQQLSR